MHCIKKTIYFIAMNILSTIGYFISICNMIINSNNIIIIINEISFIFMSNNFY